MSKWKKKLYNPVYIKETKLRVRNIKFALTILFYNLILIGIAVFGFEVLFNSGMNDYETVRNRLGKTDGIHQYGVVIGGFQFAGDFHCIHHWWSCLS